MSDLLNSASLVLIPSGYKEDTVYSVVPSDGSGDLSFTRASNGTRVNSAGLVEVVAWNLIGYSEEFNNAYWTKDTSTITANDAIAPNGTTTADKVLASAGNGNHGVYNATPFVTNFVGEVYTYSVYAKKGNVDFLVLDHFPNYTFTWFNLNTGTVGTVGTGVTATIESVGNGWYRCSCTKAIISTSSNFVGYYLSNANNTSSFNATGNEFIYLWGAQSNFGSTAKPYFPTTDRLNVPRLTYQNGGGGCPSLLLEKQSTNLVTYSNDATQQGVNNMSATANTATSPDGTQNADTITPSAGTSDHYLITGGASVSSGVIFTASVFVKKKDSDYLYFGTGGAAAWGSVAYRFSTNTFFNVGGGVTSYSATDMGNGWIRLTNTGTTGGTDLRILLTPSDSSGARTFNANGTDGLYIWGLQIEQSSYVTSAIETTSSSATRVADACFKTGISSLIGQTSGTMFIDTYVGNETDEVYGWLQASLSGNPNDSIQINRAGSNVQCQVYSGATVDGIITGGTIAKGQRIKIAVGYANNDLVLYLNGTQIGVDTSTAIPTCAVFQLGAYPPLPNDYTNDGGINQAVLFKTRLTNAELASLTTL